MIDIIKTDIYKQYRPLRIDKIKEEKTTDCKISNINYYRITNTDNMKIGTFSFSKSGEIANLEINETFRRKKTGVFALLSILDFAREQAEELELDYLFFRGHDSNPNNVVRLYSKIAVKFNDLLNNFFIIPVSKKGQEIIEDFKNLTIKLPEDEVKNILPI